MLVSGELGPTRSLDHWLDNYGSRGNVDSVSWYMFYKMYIKPYRSCIFLLFSGRTVVSRTHSPRKFVLAVVPVGSLHHY